MSFSQVTAKLLLLVIALCCLLSGGTVALANDLKLRDGAIIKADEVWERDGQIWYRQERVTRSIPKSEVLQFGETQASLAKNLPSLKLASVRKSKRGNAALPTVASATPKLAEPVTPNANAKSVTRIIFKDGTTIDADSSWESDGKVGYRLGNMLAFIEKNEIAKVLHDYVAPPPDEPIVTAAQDFKYTTGHLGLDQLITSNAARHDVDPLLIFFVMQAESGFNHRAVSRVGAQGLMQLMPGTARQLGVRNIHDPGENVEAGTRYLKNLLQRFSGDVNLALAAYNAGENAVERYGNRIPPYRETVNYVRRISWAYYRARQ